MPYIKQEDRQVIDPQVYDLNCDIANVGDLNYAITMLVNEYLDNSIVNYQNINAVIGVLECAKLELYRRLAAPYEDTKIQENGDVKFYEGRGSDRD